MIKAVIFDVDGTLLDTERIGMQAWQDAAAQFGYTISDQVLKATRGVSRREGIRIFRQALGDDFPYEQMQPIRVRIGEERIHSGVDLIKPGVLKSLSLLKSLGIPMAVASSTVYETTREHLEHFGLLPYFDAVVGGDMIEKGKPNPDIFLKAAAMLGVDPKECMVIEDSPAGVQAGHNAGMAVVLIPDCIPANEHTAAMSRFVLSDMTELVDILLHLCKS